MSDDELSKLLESQMTTELEWYEPWEAVDPEGNDQNANVVLRATVQDCINMSRAVAKRYGRQIAGNDAKLLHEFIVVHWASVVSKDNAGRGQNDHENITNVQNAIQEDCAMSFVETYNAKATEVNQTSIDKGRWKGDRNEGEMIALMHSELSEALEALRYGNPPDDHIPEFTGVEAELADVIIRIMDFGHAKGYRIAEALETKTAFNKTRPHKHGGKKF